MTNSLLIQKPRPETLKPRIDQRKINTTILIRLNRINSLENKRSSRFNEIKGAQKINSYQRSRALLELLPQGERGRGSWETRCSPWKGRPFLLFARHKPQRRVGLSAESRLERLARSAKSANARLTSDRSDRRVSPALG